MVMLLAGDAQTRGPVLTRAPPVRRLHESLCCLPSLSVPQVRRLANYAWSARASSCPLRDAAVAVKVLQAVQPTN